MATTMVTVNVPDGVYAGNEFVLEYEGQQLSVVCPEGCGPGDEINLEIPAASGGAGSGDAPPPSTVEVTIPDGCFPGMEFTVDFNGRTFNIAVPDGCEPGQPLQVEVPPEDPPPEQPSSSSAHEQQRPPPPPPPPPPPQPKPDANKYGNLHIPPFRGGPNATANPNSVAGKNADWQPAGSLFAMGPSEGFGREAGDFHIGQLVQVSRSDGSWTYGKIMDYDPTADTYSVMTRAGPKHFVDRADLTDDIVVNPSDGSCAQQ